MLILKVFLIIIWLVVAYMLFIISKETTTKKLLVYKEVVTDKKPEVVKVHETIKPKAETIVKPVEVIKEIVLEKEVKKVVLEKEVKKVASEKEVKKVVLEKEVKKVASEKEVKEVVSEKEEEVDFSNVEIFTTPLKVDLNFYQKLTPKLKAEFDQYYVLDNPKHLVKTLEYKVDGNNELFFKYVFNHLYTYRKLISSDLVSVLTDELIRLAEDNKKIQSIIYEIATRTTYFRRKEPVFLALSEKYARIDLNMQRTVFNPKNQYVYSYTRLAIILEKKKQFDEALDIVEDALQRNLSDNTVTGYIGRKTRIIEKKEKPKA
jgi:hypothetical protein